MKTNALLFCLLVIVFCSACNQKSSLNNNSAKTEVPEPLQDEDGSIGLKKMSREASLMQSIYADQVTKRPDLKQLEDQLQHFNDGKPDSLAAFDKYAQTCNRYYDSANGALREMKDTVMRNRLRLILAESKHKYEQKTNRFSVLMKYIDSNQTVFNDYYATLKIAVSLPVIEKYQDKNQPGAQSVDALSKEAQNLKSQAVKLAGKYGKVK